MANDRPGHVIFRPALAAVARIEEAPGPKRGAEARGASGVQGTAARKKSVRRSLPMLTDLDDLVIPEEG